MCSSDLQLLDDGFFEHLVDGGYIEESDVEEEEDNCENGTYNCDSCSLNGDCPQQGADGKPRWIEAVGFDEFCSRFLLCEGCPIRDIPGECEDENWPKWKEEHANGWFMSWQFRMAAQDIGKNGVIFYAMPAGVTTRFPDEEIIRAERRMHTAPTLEGRKELIAILNRFDRGHGDVDDVIDVYEDAPRL